MNIVSWFQNVPFKCNLYHYVEETELAKAKMLEKTRKTTKAGERTMNPFEGGGFGVVEDATNKKRAALPKRQQQPANLSANFSLHRKMFARSFGQGGGPVQVESS